MLNAFQESLESYDEWQSLKAMNEHENDEYKKKKDAKSNDSEKEEIILSMWCMKKNEMFTFCKDVFKISKEKFIKTLKTRSSNMNYRWLNFYLFNIWDDESLDNHKIKLRSTLHIK